MRTLLLPLLTTALLAAPPVLAQAQQPATPAPPAPSAADPAPAPQAAPPDLRPGQLDPSEPGGPGGPAPAAAVEPARPGAGAMLDGHVRQGPFLAGPGSLAFVLNHSLLGAGAGLALTGIPNRFDLSDESSRVAMLVGTLVGTGVGFGTSAWYQFNNWMDRPVASLAVANTVMGGMFTTGFVDLFSDDALVLASAAVAGAELGSWLTATVGGGELKESTALFVGSGGAWGLAYSALLLATLHTSGSRFDSVQSLLPPLLLAPGIGAGAMALASMRYSPTTAQVMRANLFGGAVGAGVLLLSALVVGGFNSPIPYVLGFISSAGAMTAVSLLWEESAERPSDGYQLTRRRDRPYKAYWW